MVQAAGFNFSRFRNEMQTKAARGNQFRVDINAPASVRQFIPNSIATEELLSFKAKAGSIPALDLDTLTLPFRGRKLKIAGDRELQPWSVEIYMTDGLPERKFFETWQDSILGVDDASRNPTASLDYFADGAIHQLTQNGNIMASWDYEGIWPQSIGETSFSFDDGEVIALQVTFEINNIRTAGVR